MVRLFEAVELAGIKESGFSTPEMAAHLRGIEGPIKIFTGQSFNLSAALDLGAVGSICPVATLMPRTTLGLVEAHGRGDRDRAAELQDRLFDGLPIVTPGSIPPRVARVALRLTLAGGVKPPKPVGVPHGGVKEALAAVGIIRCASVRCPQPSLSKRKIQEIRSLAPTLVEL